MTIKPYSPHLECESTSSGPTGACQGTLNKMEASRWPQSFGRAGDPDVQVALPVTVVDGKCDVCPSLFVGDFLELTSVLDDNICAVTVAAIGKPVTTSWYDLWADAVALRGVCVARGKWGSSIVGGESIALHMRDQNPRSLELHAKAHQVST